jgi:hypothetical protein
MIEFFQPLYIDPGTGMQFFSSVGPLLAALFAGMVGVVLWPFRKIVALFVADKKRAWVIALVTLLPLLAAGTLYWFAS